MAARSTCAGPLALALLAAAASEGRAQQIGETRVLASMVGRVYTPAAGQESIGLYGADLGHVLEHEGELRILFGDSWESPTDTSIGLYGDDTQGIISLSSFPDGDAVEAWVTAHPAPPGAPTWHAAGPPIEFRTNFFGQVAAQYLARDGVPLEMGPLRAAVTAFSNGRDGMFALFGRNAVVECGASRSCPESLDCDTGIGRCFPTFGDASIPCVLGTRRCFCLRVAGGGMCQDRSSSFYDPTTEDGRVMSLALRQEVGNADRTIQEVYATQAWVTNKFVNTTARTVDDFDPARALGVGNDYRRADGAGTREREKVFLWGRPFAYAGGIDALGLNAKLYFAYVDMPEFDAAGHFAWTPHYFTGVDSQGAPRFSNIQADAAPLDLSGGADPTAEERDLVLFSSVAWLGSPIDKWVMFYGGGSPPGPLEFWQGPNWTQAERNPHGAIYARFATLPWGPWSAPEILYTPGDPEVSPLESEYAPGGILHHPDCSDATCALSDQVSASTRQEQYGWAYAPAIIPRWITPREDGAYDLYWNLSSSNPYQVVLMKTRIEP